MAFQFDDTKNFTANLAGFLDYMEKRDPEMGAILRKHVADITMAADDSQRSSARALFNLGVKTSIDEYLIDLLDKDGKD